MEIELSHSPNKGDLDMLIFCQFYHANSFCSWATLFVYVFLDLKMACPFVTKKTYQRLKLAWRYQKLNPKLHTPTSLWHFH